MGAGKTTVGRQLARRLKKRFVDCDHELERRLGVTIQRIFEHEGEEGFRQRETALLSDLVHEQGMVLATGGGIVMRPENRALLVEHGFVIYLCVSPSVLWERLRHDRHRPLLKVEDPRQRIIDLYNLRDGLYRGVADVIVQGGQMGLMGVVRRVEREWRASTGTTHPARALPAGDAAAASCVQSIINSAGAGRPTNSAMQTLTVDLGSRSYPIHIGPGLLRQPQLLVPHLRTRRAVIVTNEVVAPLYLATLRDALASAGVACSDIVLPDGEVHKNSDSLNRIYDNLLERRCERSTTLIALGGGVIGDLCGYAAATYQRGVPFIQIPTTLLAQVDSSVGGKTGINHRLGKNMIGAFHQPKLVLADTETLDTLPAREFSAGLAEVIKYGLIRDREFLEWLETNMARLLAREPAALAHAIYRACATKAAIVAEDETETGNRALLNLGHTFGHAIETGSGYGVWLHGEAVAAGTLMAAELSRLMGWLTQDDVARTRRILEAAKLPLDAPSMGVPRYLELMAHDKKVQAGRLRLILLRALGDALICDNAGADAIAEAISACCPAHA